MGWMRTILLGDVGNRLDIADTERDIHRLRRSLRVQGSRDQQQDDRLATLERENEELKLCVGALMRRLVSKRILTREDLETLTGAVEDEPTTPDTSD